MTDFTNWTDILRRTMRQSTHPTPPVGRLTRRQRLWVTTLFCVLVWATYLLSVQTAHGQEVAPMSEGVVVMLRQEVTVTGEAVRLRDVVRWDEFLADELKDIAVPLADLTVATIPADASSAEVSVDQIVKVLVDNGVPISRLRLHGPTTCTITRSSDEWASAFDEEAALADWAGEPIAPATPQPAAASEPAAPSRSLLDLLKEDLAARTGLPAESIDLHLRPRDAELASIPDRDISAVIAEVSGPADLGRVGWTVTTSDQQLRIAGTATATVDQLVAARAVGRGQVLREVDLSTQQVQITKLADRGLTLDQAVGNQAARDLAPGEVLTADRVAPRMLVKRGQFVTVTLQKGGIEIRTVGRAMEDGYFGQTIKVRNENTREVYAVTLNAPQNGVLQRDGGVASVGE